MFQNKIQKKKKKKKEEEEDGKISLLPIVGPSFL
jgi:hypothetical protein